MATVFIKPVYLHVFVPMVVYITENASLQCIVIYAIINAKHALVYNAITSHTNVDPYITTRFPPTPYRLR